MESEKVTLEELREKTAEFARERDWDQFHSPRNLLLALVGEVGELSEIFQWRGEVSRGLPGWDEADKVHLGEELSDVLLYLVRLADICGVDLGHAVLRKVGLNAAKYPVARCRGSSKRHMQHTNSNSNGGGSDDSCSGDPEDGNFASGDDAIDVGGSNCEQRGQPRPAVGPPS